MATPILPSYYQSTNLFDVVRFNGAAVLDDDFVGEVLAVLLREH